MHVKRLGAKLRERRLRLRWFGHIQIRNEDDIVNRTPRLDLPGTKKEG